ncbi:MAG: hypothetical protein P8Y67_01450 [Alphaproteobacteria bacterium]
MRSRNAILVEILLVVGAIILIPILVSVVNYFRVEPGEAQYFRVEPGEAQSQSYMILLPIIPMLYLAFKSSKWLVIGAEKFTGFQLVFFGKGMLFIFFAGMLFSLIIIPLGLVGLIWEYVRTKPA